MNLPKPKVNFKEFNKVIPLAILSALVATLSFYSFTVTRRASELSSEINEVKSEQKAIEESLAESLYEDHLKLQEKDTIELELANLKSELETMKAGSTSESEVSKVNDIFDNYEIFKTKLSRNEGVKLDSADSRAESEDWAVRLLNKEFDALNAEITAELKELDDEYNKYVASLPPPPAVNTGSSYKTVQTEKGSFGAYVVKASLSSTRVKTFAVIDSDCSKDCPTKSLADYIKENNGFAGMNGSYFCPPDYADCANKKNSFDYALYDSNDKKWINKGALTWFKTGMMTFNGSSASFYKKTSDYGGGGVEAAISNYPSLLKDGNVVVDNGELTSYQKVKGTRGAIGVDGDDVYLVVVSSASVEDAAYVMKALGAKHALNLDGGGSSALYVNGGYVVGPGRSLPNAVVLVKK